MTLKYDLLTLKMTPGGVENVTIELAVLKNPHLDPDNMFLALLEVILVQKRAKMTKIHYCDLEI